MTHTSTEQAESRYRGIHVRHHTGEAGMKWGASVSEPDIDVSIFRPWFPTNSRFL